MKKLIVFLIVFAVMTGCTTSVSTEKDLDTLMDETMKEEIRPPQDDVGSLLQRLADDTGIVFSDIEETEFKWMASEGSEDAFVTLDVKGKEMKAKGVMMEGWPIEEFFKRIGFDMDIYNIADGTITGQRGYQQDRMVCTVLSSIGEDEEDIPTDIYGTDFKVRCGLLEE